MKKITTSLLGVMLVTLGNANARIGWEGMGPYPTPYNPQSYQTVAAYPVSPQQAPYIQRAFADMKYAFNNNHASCNTRGECLRRDLSSLTAFVNMNPSHPANPLFQKIYNLIRNDSKNQKFTSQWVIFQNLSPQRQNEFRDGLRIAPLRPQKVNKAWGAKWITAPALFNQDDVFTAVLQEIDHHHKNCDGYIGCLSADFQIINGVRDRLSNVDPARTSLSMLREIVRNKGNQAIFNSDLYLTLYNPLGPNWYDTARKHNAKHLAGTGYTQWHQIKQNSRQAKWYSARITNGTPVTITPSSQNPAFTPTPYPVAPGNPQKSNALKEILNVAKKYIDKW
ncbi:MAG: hypothetical protein ACOH2E_04795 [Candidatus Paracaedibacter sp.]